MKTQEITIGLSALSLVGIVVLVAVGLGAALKPVLFAMLLAYLSFPLILKIEQKGVPRLYAIWGVFVVLKVVFVVSIYLFVPLLIEDAQRFIRELPETSERFISQAEGFAHNIGLEIDLSHQGIKSLLIENIAVLSEGVAKTTAQSVQGLFGNFSRWFSAIAGVILFPIVFFHLINHYENISREIRNFVPKRFQPILDRYLKMSNGILSGYIRGQLLVAVILSFLYGVGLWLVDLPFGLLIGIISGMMSIVPYAGFTIGFLIALITMAANFTGMGLLIGVIMVYAIVQTLESLFITPRLVGAKVGISPIAGILAIIIGGNLFGFIGVLFGIPVAAILKSIVHDLRDQYLAIDD